jgi:hypothetical protein
MNSLSLYWILLLLYGLGTFLLAQQALDLVFDLLSGLGGLLQRRLQPAAVRRLKEFQQLSGVQPGAASVEARRKATLLGLLQWRPFWIAAAGIAALLLSDSLRSPLAGTVILVAGELYRSTYRSRRLQRLNEDAGNLIVQFSARFPITRSVAKTLKDAFTSLPGGEVRTAVEACLRRLQMNQAMTEVIQPLERLDYPALNRFAQLLASVQDTNQDVFVKTLDILKNEVEGRMELHRQARQSLTLVRSTARILQAVVVVAAVLSSTLPNWRSYFVQSTRNWLLYAGMLAVASLGSLYVEAELRQMEI